MAGEQFLIPGETCWRSERADSLRIIIDGADYFTAVKRAMLEARHTIMMIGWDFDTRIEFEPDGQTMDGPDTLGDFLVWLTKTREDLQLYMLKWDLGTLQSLERGMVPIAVRPMRLARNFHFKLDTEHPTGAAHHSKMIVIDDQVAFCGGIDMTAGRWDTRDHLDEQPCRVMPGDGEPLKPWHDVTTAVSGSLAGVLGDLARQRWYRATCDRLDPPEDDGGAPAWPDLETTFEDIPVGVARTYPDYKDFPEVREIEALYLKAIAEVCETFYVETQYLASARIARAIAERLAEPDGPEFVIVLPHEAEGWLREKAMDGARKRLLEYLWANDPHDRFAAYYPVTEGGAGIYVHAKVLTVDDRLLRVGSSNLNNRSMGFDTECDLAIEAAACDDPGAVSETIMGLRRDLLCEHLDVSAQDYDATLAQEGGLIAMIEALRGDGRSLRPFTRNGVNGDASVLAENEFADPEAVGDGLADRLAGGLHDLLENAGLESEED
ncbi:phospholipase D-like domain-containing protein [Henriciella aquimarina]|uniref:phospholipase D-like domain-containing protein n=1 Tax=Henriciella aquimarina TaxID=545261 RepID=UPI001F33BE1B|nr:phospholipase D-like domain-containing protein [Henriciella aquimarina]